jgi:SCP-2 sterol transfer family
VNEAADSSAAGEVRRCDKREESIRGPRPETTGRPMAITEPANQLSTSEFFDELDTQPHPLLARTTGTIRFDVTHGDSTQYWHLTIAKGDIAVSREPDDADSIVRIEQGLFDDIVAGRANAMSAVLRGEVGIDGDPELLMRFQRTFPGPPETRKS